MGELPAWRCRTALGAVALAIFLSGQQQQQQSDDTRLLAGLQRVAERRAPPRGLRVMIGVNANLDLIAAALPTFELAGVKAPAAKEGSPSANAADASSSSVESLGALSSTFFSFFSAARAGERPMSDAAGFRALVAAARRVPASQGGHALFPGGNAALMGRKFAAEGCAVTLAGPAGEELQRMLAVSAATAAAGGSLTLLPSMAEGGALPEEDVHLILEYARGTAWGGATASRANRFILNRGNAELISHLHGFEDMVARIKADAAAPDAAAKLPQLLVLSGLNIMENHLPAFRTAKLATVRAGLAATAGALSIPTHLELASVADAALVAEIAEQLFPVVHSAGLNEQELADLFEALGGTYDGNDITREGLTGAAAHSKDVPVPAMVERALRYVMGERPEAASGTAAAAPQLLRVHFHCLAYHIVAERPRARTFFSAEPAAALARGSVTATTQACDRTVAQLGAADVRLLAPTAFATSAGATMRISATEPTPSWLGSGTGTGADEGGIRFTLAPVLVCQKLVKSVGLGDAISAAGLAHSI